MIMKLKSFKRAQEDSVKAGWNCYPDRVCGLGENAAPWEQYVEVFDTGDIIDNSPLYDYVGYRLPACCFEDANTLYKDEPKPIRHEDALHYGTILTDDQLYDRCDDMAANLRIYTISYDGAVFYLRMVNGEVDEFKKIGEIA